MSFKSAIDKIYFIDGTDEHKVIVRGWCFSKSELPIKLRAQVNGKDVLIETDTISRPEVYGLYPKYKSAQESGYRITAYYPKSRKYCGC